MRVFWQYIQGMVSLLLSFSVEATFCLTTLLSQRITLFQLTNLGALPLARIHSTLNMLVPTYKGKTTDELTAFLEAMRAEGLVEKTASGSWKIVK